MGFLITAVILLLLLFLWLFVRLVHVALQIRQSRTKRRKSNTGLQLLFSSTTAANANDNANNKKTIYPLKTLVVLGSGGHTTEMLNMVSGLNSKYYFPIVYIKAETDQTSVMRLERKTGPLFVNAPVIDIPRSREVGQSYFSSIFTTLRATSFCFWLVKQQSPQLILLNGPGTCIPIAVIAMFWRICGFMPTSTTIVFVESFCRVQSLSLSGKIMYWIADLFVVHWEELQQKYPSSILSSQFVAQRESLKNK